MTWQTYEISDHALRRCQQRGIPLIVLLTILDEADSFAPVGSGATANYVSKHRRRELIGTGVPARVIEKTAGILVIIEGGKVVTVMHDRGRRGRP